MRVRACLRRARFVSVSCNDELLELQHLSVRRNLLQLDEPDF
jgi:hypothetical protein